MRVQELVQELAEGEAASLLEVRDLSVAYGNVDALHGATLRVNAGPVSYTHLTLPTKA